MNRVRSTLNTESANMFEAVGVFTLESRIYNVVLQQKHFL